jgi:hypothetical protein
VTKLRDLASAAMQQSKASAALVIGRLQRILTKDPLQCVESVNMREDLTPSQKVRLVFLEIRRRYGCTSDVVVRAVEIQLEQMGVAIEASDLLTMVNYITVLLPERQRHARPDDPYTVQRVI